MSKLHSITCYPFPVVRLDSHYFAPCTAIPYPGCGSVPGCAIITVSDSGEHFVNVAFWDSIPEDIRTAYEIMYGTEETTPELIASVRFPDGSRISDFVWEV